jgi:hypothetical protein
MMSLVFVIGVFAMAGAAGAAIVTDFEDLTLGPESRWNGSDSSGGFASGSAWFGNIYDTKYGSWEGFAYSNKTDPTIKGWTSEYNAITGSGQGGSANYAVGYYVDWPAPRLPTMTLSEPTIMSGLYVTNNNWAYYYVTDRFGSGDWFLLEITGRDALGNITNTVPFYLADFQNGKSDIVNEWRYVDLTSLGVVKSVEFSLSSTDNDPVFGINTPAYFVIDTIMPEPATMVLLALGGLLISKREKS